jgi:hypothetical protein
MWISYCKVVIFIPLINTDSLSLSSELQYFSNLKFENLTID